MLEHFWWGSVFLLGVPAMALLLILGPVVLPEYRDPAARRLDLGSVALSLATILPVVYALTELARAGWRPLLDLRLLTSKTFAAAMSGMTLSTMLTGAIMLLVTQYFELANGLSPARAGLCLVPAAVTMTASSLGSPRLARRVQPGYVIAAGLVAAIAGLLLISQAHGLAPVVAGWALVTLGSGPMVVLAAVTVTAVILLRRPAPAAPAPDNAKHPRTQRSLPSPQRDAGG